MYIATVPNRNSPPAILLREDKRVGGKVIKRTLSNLTHWPKNQVDAFRLLLKGEQMVPARSHFKILKSVPHGHVEVLLGLIRRLRLDSLISSKACVERALIVAALTQLVIDPESKLAITRSWNQSTLAEELGVAAASAEDLYRALDWLLKRQSKIEKRLARRHFKEGGVALYDLSSCSYYGRTCPLAKLGHNRDKKRGVACIAFGLLAAQEGRPVAIEVYPGNTGDPSTVPDQVEKLRKDFNLERVILVGDRGMLTQTRIDTLKTHPGLGWISALKSSDIRSLLDKGEMLRSLFDQTNLAEISSPDFPKERLIACFNPLLADERRRKRQELLTATEAALKRIAEEVKRRTTVPLSAGEIGEKVGRAINRFKMRKHFKLTIKDNLLEWTRQETRIRREFEMDGIYVIRTSSPQETLSAQDTVRTYKSLERVERAFRSLKGVLEQAGPIRHRIPNRVRAHFLLAMLAYYVQWHLEKDLAPLLFVDEDLPENRKTREPVAPAIPSEHAQEKKSSRITEEGFTVHSLRTLMESMSTRCRNTCEVAGAPGTHTFVEATEPSALHTKVFDLLGLQLRP